VRKTHSTEAEVADMPNSLQINGRSGKEVWMFIRTEIVLDDRIIAHFVHL